MHTVNLQLDYTNKSAKWTTNNSLPTRDVWLPTPGTVLKYDRFVLKNPGYICFNTDQNEVWYLDLSTGATDSAIVRRFNLDGSLQLGSYTLPVGVPYTGISRVPSSANLIAVFNSSGTGSIDYHTLASPGSLSSTPFPGLLVPGFTMLSNIYLFKDSASADRPIFLSQQIAGADTYNILQCDASLTGRWTSNTLMSGGGATPATTVNFELFKFITFYEDPSNNVTVLSQRTATNPTLPLTWWIRTFRFTLVAGVPTLTLLGSPVQITFPPGAVTPTGISVVYNTSVPSNSRLFVSFQENLVAQYTIFPFSTVSFVKVYGSATASSEFGYFNNPIEVLSYRSETTGVPHPQFYVIEQGNKRISQLTSTLTTPWNYLSSWGTPVLNATLASRLQVASTDPLLSIAATRQTSNKFVYTLNNKKTVYQYDTNGVYTGVSVTATLNNPKLVVAGINFDGFYVLDQTGANEIIMRAFTSAGVAVGTPLSTGIVTVTLGFNMAVLNSTPAFFGINIDNIYFIAGTINVRVATFTTNTSSWSPTAPIVTLPAFGVNEVPRFVGFDFNPQTNDSSLHVITNRPGDGRVSVYAYSLSGTTGTLRTGLPWSLFLTSGLASANVDNYGRITFQDLTSTQLRVYQPTVAGNYAPGNYTISSFGTVVAPSALGGNLTTDNLGHTYILETTTSNVNTTPALAIYSFQIMSTLLDLGWNFDSANLNVANCQMERTTVFQASDFVTPANLVSGSCYNIVRDPDVGTTSVIAPTIRTKLNDSWLRSVTPMPSNSVWNVMWHGPATVEADFMSGACCVGENTLVTTEEFGEVPIHNIRTGNHVWDVQQGDWVKVEKNIRFTTPVRQGVLMAGRGGDMFILGDHPVLQRENGAVREVVAKDLIGQPGVSRIEYDMPVYVHTLCTERRSFVLMQSQFAVGAWSESAWENYLLNDKTRAITYDCM